MAIGNQPDPGGLNAKLGTCAVTLRDAMQQIQDLWAFVQAEGESGLQTIGFSSGDAAAFFNAANYLQTVAQIYFGTASQPSDFDFDSALALVRGAS